MPSLGTDTGSEQGDRILTRNETVAPTQDGKDATAQDNHIVHEGNEYPTLASIFTGIEQNEIQGRVIITSKYRPVFFASKS